MKLQDHNLAACLQSGIACDQAGVRQWEALGYVDYRYAARDRRSVIELICK